MRTECCRFVRLRQLEGTFFAAVLLTLSACSGSGTVALTSVNGVPVTPSQPVAKAPTPTPAQAAPNCAPQTGSFAVTATGFGPGATIQGDVLYKYYPCEKLVHLFLPALYGPSNANTFSAGPLPDFLIPATIPYQEHIVAGYDNDVEQAPINVVIQAGNPTLIYCRDGTVSGWTPSASKGTGLQVITVFLD